MLYDQAQLLSVYIDLYKITSDKYYLTIAEDIISYVGRDLKDVNGGFYSAQDADSLPNEKCEAKKGWHDYCLFFLTL